MRYISLGMTNGLITAVRPRTKPMLAILEPMTLPSDISG